MLSTYSQQFLVIFTGKELKNKNFAVEQPFKIIFKNIIFLIETINNIVNLKNYLKRRLTFKISIPASKNIPKSEVKMITYSHCY